MYIWLGYPIRNLQGCTPHAKFNATSQLADHNLDNVWNLVHNNLLAHLLHSKHLIHCATQQVKLACGAVPSSVPHVHLGQRQEQVCVAEQELLNINLMKGIRESVGAAEFMARVAVDIKTIAVREGEAVEEWHDLGRGDWSNDEGTVSAFPGG